MSKTGRLGLPYILQAQAQKEVTHNQALNKLDVYVNSVAEAIVDALPSEAKEGSIYIIGNELAQYINGSWTLYPALEWMEVRLSDTKQKVVFCDNKWSQVTAPSNQSNDNSGVSLKIEQWEEDIALSGVLVKI